MFSFLKNAVTSIYQKFSSKIFSLFPSGNVYDKDLDKLFELLVSFDLGVAFSRELIAELKNLITKNSIKSSKELVNFLKNELLKQLQTVPSANIDTDVILFFGINGAGKTTSSAKIAARYARKGERVLLVAADTYRAAAVEQLAAWGEKTGVEVFIGKPDSDPSSVIFDAAMRCKVERFDKVLIDTSGRLHTNANLVKELEKIVKTTKKCFDQKTIASWLVLDSLLGQSSFEQVKTFGSAVSLDAVVLTKLDGSSKGGVVVAIAREFKLPVAFVTFAENDLTGVAPFDPEKYIKDLFED